MIRCWGRYVSWVILGQVADLDAFVEANVTTVADWDANFKMLKVQPSCLFPLYLMQCTVVFLRSHPRFSVSPLVRV